MILAEIATIITLIVLISSGFALGNAWIAYMALVIVLCSGMIYYDIAIVMLAAKYAMDEFILCSVLLYVDIMRMLFYLLLILGKSK
jgi:FtsH-binding integral membrane protein